MSSKLLTNLTIAVGVAAMIALLAWRVFHLPPVYLYAILILWGGASLLLLSQTLPHDDSHFLLVGSWRGAIVWLGCIPIATGLLYAISAVTGDPNPMTWEEWSQSVFGFILAYALVFVLFQGVRWYSRR